MRNNRTSTALVKHARKLHSGRALRVVALAATAVLAFGSAGMGAGASRLTGNLVTVDLDEVITHERPPQYAAPAILSLADVIQERHAAFTTTTAANTPVNILIMGTDDRSGDNGELAGRDSGGARSDSTIILHISGNREWAAAVSIPRDTIVNIPSCPTSSGRYTAARPTTRFNAAFAYGALAGKDVASGALCTLTTVEAITNIRLDGFVVLDFAGFKNMVDALGGVELDIPRRIRSPLAGDLKLEPGLQVLDGWHALQYSRARTGVGLGGGSDLERIKRQQTVIAAIANQVMATNLLTNSAQLFRFLDATTSYMTTSANYATINGLAELAVALSSVDPAEIDFIMAPVRSNPLNPNTVLFASAAKDLWAALRFDNRPAL